MKTFMEIAQRLVEASDDIELLQEPNAGHYLEVVFRVPIDPTVPDGMARLEKRRLGRDIELYQFMGKVQGMGATVCNFLAEVGIPLKNRATVYPIIVEELTAMGREIFNDEQFEEWKGCFV